jgi:hypothetical protein
MDVTPDAKVESLFHLVAWGQWNKLSSIIPTSYTYNYNC